ncbi:MAG: inorganic diphosphatase [Rhodocyclaceae bacterium]|nr:inorganic diphosphatase [Rhodocyclaceae bacterium]
MPRSRSATPFDILPPFQDADIVNVIVETPAGYRSKLKYDPKAGVFALGKILPEGFVFPFDFGFVPGTRAADGDPVDVMLIAESGSAPGCLVPARLLGVLEAEQRKLKEDGKAMRNDRILAVPLPSRQYADLSDIDKMSPALREQIEYFLISYGVLEGKEMRITGVAGPAVAATLVKQAARKK